MNEEYFMKKTKKELIKLLLEVKTLRPDEMTIYLGERQVMSIPVEKDWNATTISLYHQLKNGCLQIDEVALWNEHMIDKYKKSKKKLFSWWRFGK